MTLSLLTIAELVDEYSQQPDNPNISAWLRGGLIEQLALIEHEAQAEMFELMAQIGTIEDCIATDGQREVRCQQPARRVLSVAEYAAKIKAALDAR